MLIIPLVDLTYQIEGHRYPLQPGQALLVNPYLQRSIPALHQDYLRLVVSFVLSSPQDYLPANPLMTITDAAWQLIDSLLQHYLKEEFTRSHLTLTLLMCELSRHAFKTDQRKPSEKVNYVMILVNQHLQESFSIKDLAAHAQVSPSHLRRLFREDTGVSLGDYMARHRLNAAKRLLLETTQKIETVAVNCGYDSIYSFSRFFKTQTGLSPSAFRKADRSKPGLTP
jgi:AraC family transcriptional regulator of arabinose operon/AraC family L-rhamnose operon transcriptional activator RhaR